MNEGSIRASLLHSDRLGLIKRPWLNLEGQRLRLRMGYSVHRLRIVDSERQIDCTLSIECLNEVIDSWLIGMSNWGVVFGGGDG